MEARTVGHMRSLAHVQRTVGGFTALHVRNFANPRSYPMNHERHSGDIEPRL
jgi:hypothetical protein